MMQQNDSQQNTIAVKKIAQEKMIIKQKKGKVAWTYKPMGRSIKKKIVMVYCTHTWTLLIKDREK